MSDNIPLLLFAKAPIPGKVKTRLQSHCTAVQAAGIARILMEESIRTATTHWPGRVYLSVWLNEDHPFFAKMLAKYPIGITSQCAGDLGAKMQNAMESFGYPAAVMGCDAPHVSPDTLRFAYQHLDAGESVIGPSGDGGYYLIALAASHAELFQDVYWGSDQVMETTLAIASRLQLELRSLASLNDVDEWPDLLSAAQVLPSLNDYLKEQRLV